MGVRKKTSEEFIEEATIIHKGKYDYSLSWYVNRITKLIIICPIHGEFLQEPGSHLKGYGCSKCGRMKIQKTSEEFIEEIKILHPELIVEGIYDGQLIPILVRDMYGLMLCNPDNLLRNHKPSILSAVNRTEYFKAMFKYKHPELSKKITLLEDWIGSTKKMRVNNGLGYGDCWVMPNSLLLGRMPTIQSAVNQNEYWTNMAIEEHNIKGKAIYGYNRVNYNGNKKQVDIECPIHGYFKQTPADHLDGCGCPDCANELKGYSRTNCCRISRFHLGFRKTRT